MYKIGINGFEEKASQEKINIIEEAAKDITCRLLKISNDELLIATKFTVTGERVIEIEEILNTADKSFYLVKVFGIEYAVIECVKIIGDTSIVIKITAQIRCLSKSENNKIDYVSKILFKSVGVSPYGVALGERILEEFQKLHTHNKKINEKELLEIFTFDFGKMDVSMTKHFEKSAEENKELGEAVKEHVSNYTKSTEEIIKSRDKVCDEALDNVQGAISFVSHLINTGIIGLSDLERWKLKLEKRKEKYLKSEVSNGK